MPGGTHLRKEAPSRQFQQLELVNEELTAVAAGEESFRSLFENAPDAIFVEDLSGRVLDANPAACRLHRMSREELVGISVTELVPPERRAESQASFRALASGEVDRIESYSYTKQGEAVPVCVRASNVQYRGRHALLFHVSDNTEHRLLEDQLRQSQKMEAIGLLAGGVAHDFNNLLTAILGYTQLSLEALGTRHEVHDDLLEVQKAGEQAASLTRQLLAFSRQQVLEPRVMDLNEIVVNIENLCRRTIGEDVRLITRLAPDLKRVRVDEGQLEQVILNLVVNSRDAMPAGGEISIETKSVEVDESLAARRVPMQPGEYVCLSVTDTGTGMEPDVLQQVFDPFFTTKAADKGTGLGLSTVYGIVKQSGGYVFVESQLGVGTSIQVFLPPTEADVPDAIPLLAAPEVPDDKTILLTEDNRVVRELSKQVLEEMGYRVLAAETAEEALRISSSGAETIDLLVTDLVLTGMDGLTMTRKLLVGNPETKVLLMSGHSKRARFNPEPLLEGTAFLQKPFTPADLKRAVAGALQRPPPAQG